MDQDVEMLAFMLQTAAQVLLCLAASGAIWVLASWCRREQARREQARERATALSESRQKNERLRAELLGLQVACQRLRAEELHERIYNARFPLERLPRSNADGTRPSAAPGDKGL